jgi:hypothetical protein
MLGPSFPAKMANVRTCPSNNLDKHPEKFDHNKGNATTSVLTNKMLTDDGQPLFNDPKSSSDSTQVFKNAKGGHIIKI